MNKLSVLFSFLFFQTFLSMAYVDKSVVIYLSVKQDCSNCNFITHVYNQVAKKYPTFLVFDRINEKELKTYLKEIIMVPDSVKYISSDSIIKKLDGFLEVSGSSIYAYKNNMCLYASTLKGFNIKKMEQVLSQTPVNYESISIADSVSLVNQISTTANEKYYGLYSYALKKVYIYSLPEYKLEAMISHKDFNDEHIWRTIFKDTTDFALAKSMTKQLKNLVPNYEMVSVDGITTSKNELYIWISITTPKVFLKTGKKDIVDRTYLLVKYATGKKFSYYPLDEVIDKENTLVPKHTPKVSTYMTPHPLFCGNAIIIDSLLYLSVVKDETQKHRPDYNMVIYKFKENRLSFVDFYKTHIPKISTFENVSNTFYASHFSDIPIIYYSLSPSYINIKENKVINFSFLPAQHVVFNDKTSMLWNINFVYQKSNLTTLCYYDNISEKQYIVKLSNNLCLEKYAIFLPKTSSNLIVIDSSLIAIDESKDKILKFRIVDIF